MISFQSSFKLRTLDSGGLTNRIKQRIRRLAVKDIQTGPRDKYSFIEPTTFNQRERHCAKYFEKTTCKLRCQQQRSENCEEFCDQRLLMINEKFNDTIL